MLNRDLCYIQLAHPFLSAAVSARLVALACPWCVGDDTVFSPYSLGRTVLAELSINKTYPQVIRTRMRSPGHRMSHARGEEINRGPARADRALYTPRSGPSAYYDHRTFAPSGVIAKRVRDVAH